MEQTQPRRILVAEDEAGIRKLLQTLLMQEGYVVELAPDGRSGLEMALAEPPELILLDVNMPGLDGFSVCRTLKADPRTCHIPVIFISSTGEERQGLQAGAVDYISKPFNASIVKSRVRNHLKLKEYQDFLEGLVQERTKDLESANRQLQEEICIRRKAEAELKRHQEVLEEQVATRTAALRTEIEVRRCAEEKLRKSEEQYRTVFDNTGAAILILAPDLTISMANSEAERLTGFSRERLQGMRWPDLVTGRQNGCGIQPGGQSRLPGGKSIQESECTIITARGRLRNLIIKSSAFSDSGQRLVSFIDITRRKRTEAVLRENMSYLNTLMATIQTGVLVTDPQSGAIQDVNPHAAALLGGGRSALVGRNVTTFLPWEKRAEGATPPHPKAADHTLLTLKGETIHVRYALAGAVLRGRDRLIHSFLDITDLKDLMTRQELDADISKSILNLVSPSPVRSIPLPDDAALFSMCWSIPCHLHGGDHVLYRFIEKRPDAPWGTSIFSIKDQSGHQVGCVLRSILTDLLHNAVLDQYGHHGLPERMARLNQEICRSRIFQKDDFFTALFLEFDHASRHLTYASAGHPGMILIREGRPLILPQPGGPGSNLPMAFMPEITFTAARIPLRVGDRILCFTDGLTDIPLRRTGRSLSAARLAELAESILAEAPGTPVSELMDRLLAELCRMGGEEVRPPDRNGTQDDITLLGLEVESARFQHTRTIRPQSAGMLSDAVDALADTLARQWREAGFSAPNPRLFTVLEESIQNAYKHGNRCAPEKAITVRWRFGNDFHLSVSDEGEGFHPGGIPDPTQEENIAKPSGRGIYMIRHFAEEIGWTDRGRSLHMTLKKQATAGEGRAGGRRGPLMGIWRSSRPNEWLSYGKCTR